MEDIRTLSRQEAKVVLNLEENGIRQITLQQVASLLNSSYSAAAKVAARLVTKGWLERLKNGTYMFLSASYGPHKIGEYNIIAMASALYKPSYVGWWAAASYRGYTTQKPTVIHVALTHQARPRHLHDTEIRFVALVDRKFFGFQSETYFGQEIVLSTPEKTLIDCIDRLDLSGGVAEVARIASRVAKKVDRSVLIETAFRMGSVPTIQRLGYLFDVAGYPFEDRDREALKKAIGHRRSVFGRPEQQRADDIGYVPEWGLQVNISERALHGDTHRMVVSKIAPRM